MATARGRRLIGLLALVSVASARADEPTIISQQGDALARATSAQALVQPMPAYPPNTPPMPKPADPPADSSPALMPAVPAQVQSLTAAPPSAGPRGAAPAAALPSAPPAKPETAPAPGGENRAVLIALGALIALGLFLLERRKGRGA